MPRWGTSWTALPIESGWGPTLALIAVTAVLYVPAMWFTRAVTARDLPVLASMLWREN